ncbi:CPBP family intramembrane glutamic endopeptidase [Pontibacter harenae]|uniref:CPBP family intramembrane glutamic endopeptidase n=1 Tax=Pontibacter harenae TaxID=2894083 RepID=UPI001E55A20A|nr:CPBP family intramembrane glutamic endopeptidase [Pontibacter harenae]MCC9165267.1 CPBP family intramembrane metalloprotease [Pontibacter harenae]
MKGFISKDTHPVWVLLLLLAFMLGGYFVATFIFALLVEPVFGIGFMDMTGVMLDPATHPQGPDAMLMFQGVVQFISFVIAPLYLIKGMGHKIGPHLSWKVAPMLGLVLLSGLLIILIMPVNSVIIDWNVNFDFPDFMRGFEQWTRAKEEELAELTKLIANFGTETRLFLGLLVIAVIPAIGEELVFRGVVQRQLYRWVDNQHVAIWLAAIVFSAIHVQFFGFVPRVILGALFGYLYFWSGRIIVPMVAHFVNNGFTVFLLYLQQTGRIDVDVESTEPMPWYSVLVSLVLSAAVIYYLYQRFSALPVRQESIDDAEPDRGDDQDKI